MWKLDAVELSIRFMNELPASEDKNVPTYPTDVYQELLDCSGKPQSRVSGRPPTDSQRLAGSYPHLTINTSESGSQFLPKDGNPRQKILEEGIFSALLDASLRSTICSKPIRLALGVRCLSDQFAHRLCDLSPATFVPWYVQRLQEQVQYIPGISKVLSNFISAAQSPESALLTGSSRPEPHKYHEHGGAPDSIQQSFWNTVQIGLRAQHSAHRLQPLRRSQTIRAPDPALEPLDGFHSPWVGEPETQENNCWGGKSAKVMSSDASSDEDLFDFPTKSDDKVNICSSTSSMVTTKGINFPCLLAGGCSNDVEAKSGGQRWEEFYDCLFQANVTVGAPQHENSKYSVSLSQMSDVSMLLPCEGPMKIDHTIEEPQSIGGSSWLTQNVIRMHPLRQQPDEADQQNLVRQEPGLYERHDLGWWSDTSDVREEGPEVARHHHTKPTYNNLCSSSFSSSEEEKVHECLETEYNSREGYPFYGRNTPMSPARTQEETNGSLAEVLGNDHLLWHMWKRRASVAPRGEEDFTDLKTLYETDPDMKLFSSRWDLDPNDISAGSSEDPILQDSMHPQSPRDKSTSPMTPNSERRSYFPPTRSSSTTSGYVGRSSADPKRKSSLIKRFTWGGRNNASQAQSLDMSKLEKRTMEVKRRKTLNDYEAEDREASNEDDSDMLF